METVRGLLRRYAGIVYWAQAPSQEYLDAIGITDRVRVRRVAKGSPLTMWRYATAEVVFFTHGVYGEPAADPAKPTVNLWHGAGMKWSGALFPSRDLRSRPSDVILAPSRVWGFRCAEISGLATEDAMLAGYPRNDQLFRPAGQDTLAGLGITRDFVVWLPSYRNAHSKGTMRAMQDGLDLADDAALAGSFAEVVERLAAHGVQTVVKPHPLDATARAVPGAVVLDDPALEAAGVPLYTVLGAARGLITDTSSVWSDFLLLDRPIGFFFPDRESYLEGRGVYPADIFDWLPGPLLDSMDAVEEFARSLHDEPEARRLQRAATAERAGLIHTRTSADRMLTMLRERFPHLADRIEEESAMPTTPEPAEARR